MTKRGAGTLESEAQSQEEQREAEIDELLSTIKPLQNLAENFDIDISQPLEEYVAFVLNEMEVDGDEQVMSQQPTQDDSNNKAFASKTNFTRAAFIVQRSSQVYGGKVEYLYKLVLDTRADMAKSNAQHNNKNGKTRRKDDDVEEFFEFDPHSDLLLLDDVLPVDKTADCRHINLAASAQEAELTRRLTLSGGSRDSRSTAAATTLGAPTPSRASSAGTYYGSRYSTGTAPAMNASVWMGSNMAGANTGGTELVGALRLMNGVCELDETGRLILPGSQTRRVSGVSTPLEQRTRFSSTSAVNGAGEGNHNNDASNNSMLMQMNQDDDDGAGMMPPDDDDGDGGYYDADGGDDDNEGPGFVMADNDDNNNDENQDPVHTVRARAAGNDTARQVRFAPDKPDPWAMLDPHEAIKSCASSKPLRLGKTYRLPDSLKKKGSKKQEPFRPRSYALEAYLHFMNPDHFEAPKIPANGLMYGKEFEELARKALSKRNAEARRRKRQEHIEQLQRDSQPYAEEYEDMADAYNGANDEADDNGGFVGAGEDWGDGGGDDDDDFGGFMGGGDDDDDNRGPVETNTGVYSMDRGVDENDNAQADAQTFEELCRAHIRAFARGAEKYAVSTNLSKRVDEWQEKLAPKLNEEEARPVFDIHTYCQQVVDRLDGLTDQEFKNRTQSFGAVIGERPRYDVCRMFLASLALCNSGNVEFVGRKNIGDEDLKIKLLSTTLERPTETYLAPSVANSGA